MAVKTTRKRGSLVIIPGDTENKIFVNNNVPHSKYAYSLMQEKVFNYCLFHLQYYIKAVQRGESITQLDIFAPSTTDINITIPLSMITHLPSYYEKVRKACKDLAGLVIEIPYTDKRQQKWNTYQGIFSRVATPGQKNRSKYAVVQMRKDVAMQLVQMESNGSHGIHYTSFLLEVCMNAKNKYTPRIYKMLSSWKGKQWWNVKFDELREKLGLGDKYKNYDDFKRRILLPVMEELREKADVWFNIKDPMLEVRTGKKVTALHFKIITPDLISILERKAESAQQLLKDHYGFKPTDLHHLKPYFADLDHIDELMYKIVEVDTRIKQTPQAIDNRVAYMIRSIQNHFKALQQ